MSEDIPSTASPVTIDKFGIELDYLSNVKKLLEEVGDEQILSITIVRKPLSDMLSSLVNK